MAAKETTFCHVTRFPPAYQFCQKKKKLLSCDYLKLFVKFATMDSISIMWISLVWIKIWIMCALQ